MEEYIKYIKPEDLSEDMQMIHAFFGLAKSFRTQCLLNYLEENKSETSK